MTKNQNPELTKSKPTRFKLQSQQSIKKSTNRLHKQLEQPAKKGKMDTYKWNGTQQRKSIFIHTDNLLVHSHTTCT